jgi:MFS family permease
MFLTTKTFGPALLAWSFVAGFFVIAPYTYLFIYVPELFDTRLRATAFGLSIQFGRVFAGLAAILGGQLIGLFGGSYATAGACVSLFFLIGIVASFFLPYSDGSVAIEISATKE